MEDISQLNGYRWIVSGNHFAIEHSSEILHPSAKEIYDILSHIDSRQEYPDLVTAFPEYRFSGVGSPVKCVLEEKEGLIRLSLVALRKNREFSVDIVSGHIIDHCLGDCEWFFLNSDLEPLQKLIADAGISQPGVISVGQYVSLVRAELYTPVKEIENHVPKGALKDMILFRDDVPRKIRATLYEYQKTGFQWLRYITDSVGGCILGDEMGLGKTLQVITLFQNLKDDRLLPMLVVAPVSLLENWKRECAKFAPELDVFVHHGSGRTGRYFDLLKHNVVVVSYNTAVSDLSMLRMIEWECVVLDEAQNIKNPESERARSVKMLKRKRSIAVTGTPFENHITDIWSLMDFAVAGLLGSLNVFRLNVTDDIAGAAKIEPVLSPVMIRRLVADVADDLPEKVVIPQALVMAEEEQYGYEAIRKEIVKDTEAGSSLSLGLLQKLRMYCTHPFLCDSFEAGHDPYLSSVKYQRFCEIIEEIVSREEKVIIFTSFKKMSEIIMHDIRERFGIEIRAINGETPVGERQEIVDWFNEYKGPAMLVLNPKAAGTGLNITGANHVIHFNLEWNPALEDQASARAYRRGQKKTVFIYRLYYTGTVEEVVNERIEKKRRMAETAIVGTDGSDDERNDIIKALEISPTIQERGR